jgi:N-acetylmuramoyl-L-alanine amidase
VRYLARYHLVLMVSVMLAMSVLVYAYLSDNRSPGPAQTVSGQGGSAGSTTTVRIVTGPVPTVSGVGDVPELRAAEPEAAAPASAPGSLAGTVVCIDPGHASNPDLGEEANGPGSAEMKVKDPGGTSGAISGTPEYVITLAISEQLKRELETRGASVIMTREADTYYGGNIERAQTANAAGADLFIRIHCDGSADGSQNGVSTLYPSDIPGWTDDIYQQSYRAAMAVQTAMVSGLGAADDGVVARSDITGFNWADAPAILVETGFLTNAVEDSQLNSPGYQGQIAASLARGISEFLNQT